MRQPYPFPRLQTITAYTRPSEATAAGHLLGQYAPRWCSDAGSEAQRACSCAAELILRVHKTCITCNIRECYACYSYATLSCKVRIIYLSSKENLYTPKQESRHLPPANMAADWLLSPARQAGSSHPFLRHVIGWHLLQISHWLRHIPCAGALRAKVQARTLDQTFAVRDKGSVHNGGNFKLRL